MMNYEIFKEVVVEKLMDYLPEEYHDMKLVVQPVDKVNHTMDGLSLVGDGVRISPTMYINARHLEKTIPRRESEPESRKRI